MEEPNLSYVNKLSKGDLEFEKSILSIVKEELTSEVDNYYLNLKEKNYVKTKLFVHRIKHKMSILGLEESYEITNIYENSIKTLDFKNQDYFEKMLPIMLNFLKKYKN